MDHPLVVTRYQAAQGLQAVGRVRHADFHPGVNCLAAGIVNRQFGCGFQGAAVIDDPRPLLHSRDRHGVGGDGGVSRQQQDG